MGVCYHYIDNDNDIELLAEYNGEKTKQRKQLFEYYSKLLAKDGKEMSVQRKKVLRRIAFSLSEEDAQLQCDKIAKTVRLMAYNERHQEYIKKHRDEIQSIKEPLEELVEAYEDYDFGCERTVEINGNIFTFDAGNFDVEKYGESLAALGDDSKGNAWRVEIDECGEVVLHQ